ncbi:hypothetical protein PFISCL1PPCAC_22229, partial [Pristionchus fissidentatus]
TYDINFKVIFVLGVSSNISLLLAVYCNTPPQLKTYAILIKIGTWNDLMSVCCDFFTMQRMLVVPGNLLYLSTGPCALISTRACYLGYCVQLFTLVFTLYIMTASFAYRLWVLHRPPPSNRNVRIIAAMLLTPPALVSVTFTFAQADLDIVKEFLRHNAPTYLSEPGALAGHTGMTFQLVFTILFVACTPPPAYAAILVIRSKVRNPPRKLETSLSEY